MSGEVKDNLNLKFGIDAIYLKDFNNLSLQFLSVTRKFLLVMTESRQELLGLAHQKLLWLV